MKLATIKITDLALRTIIGGNDWERNTQQDVVINIVLDYDATKAIDSDAMEDTVDYKRLKRRIIDEVEKSRFHLLEKLTSRVLEIIMEDNRVLSAKVRIDKPMALRFAKTVSVEMSDRRGA
jgi:D-erythro-7,8-dihydroneopterin triphosphate epimerase